MLNRVPGLARAVALVALAASPLSTLRAAPLNPQDVLVSWAGYPSSYVQEYTRTGTLVQNWQITSKFTSEYARGIAADGAGNVDIYNGTFAPSMTTLNPVTSSMASRTMAGWNTTNVLEQGQVAVIGHYVYASDTLVSGDSGGQAGVVRFDLNDTSAPGVRFDGNEITALGKGLNGLLYAVWPNTSPGENKVDVLDPANLSLRKTLTLPVGVKGVVADAAGNLYATSGPTIYKFDADGNTLATFNTGVAGLGEMDISTSGDLVTADSGGTIVLTNTAFSSLSHFSLNYPNAQMYSSYAAFAAVPEPSSACGAAMMITLLSLGTVGRRRRGA
jgi:hypothetical protein